MFIQGIANIKLSGKCCKVTNLTPLLEFHPGNCCACSTTEGSEEGASVLEVSRLPSLGP